ncbi:uncharacterized protein LOC144713287 [Wolffia australiana]
MDWWRKMIFPVRRAWLIVSARAKVGAKAGPGILKLSDDVRSCGYEDVRVMWEILRTELEISSAAPPKRTFWNVFLWPHSSSRNPELHPQ